MTQTDSELPASLDGKFIVLVGLMGAGKSKVGKTLAKALNLPFVDSDVEVELAAGCSIDEIFERFGEEEFRKGERRVIARILGGPRAVMASGGGAFIDPQTRELIARNGISVWLRADLELLLERTGRRRNRPLLKQGNPREILSKLIDERYPAYGRADVVVDVTDEPVNRTCDKVIDALVAFGEERERAAATP